MKHQIIEAGACDTGPKKLRPDSAAYSKNTAKKQAKRTKVSGDLGPIHLLGDPPPRVVVERGDDRVLVMIEPRLWGMVNTDKVFLGSGQAANRYALSLAMLIRSRALREHERRERLKDAKVREREGGGQ